MGNKTILDVGHWRRRKLGFADGAAIFALVVAPSVAAAQLPEIDPNPMARVELVAINDARTQAGAPDVNYTGNFLHVSTPNGHAVFVQFNLSRIPDDAIIETALLRMTAAGSNAGISKEVELGVVKGAWQEEDITWATQPNILWNGKTATIVDSADVAQFDVTTGVQAFVSGQHPNYGWALRGTVAGVVKAFLSKEFGDRSQRPTLIVVYRPATDPELTLTAVADAFVRPTNNPATHLYVNTPSHASLVRFDLSDVPAGAIIDRARLRFTATGQRDTVSKEIELGVVKGDWLEDQVTTCSAPEIVWNGKMGTITNGGDVLEFDVTTGVRAFVSGQHPNYGWGLRGTAATGVVKSVWSRETGPEEGDRPTLVIEYHLPSRR